MSNQMRKFVKFRGKERQKVCSKWHADHTLFFVAGLVVTGRKLITHKTTSFMFRGSSLRQYMVPSLWPCSLWEHLQSVSKNSDYNRKCCPFAKHCFQWSVMFRELFIQEMKSIAFWFMKALFFSHKTVFKIIICGLCTVTLHWSSKEQCASSMRCENIYGKQKLVFRSMLSAFSQWRFYSYSNSDQILDRTKQPAVQVMHAQDTLSIIYFVRFPCRKKGKYLNIGAETWYLWS